MHILEIKVSTGWIPALATPEDCPTPIYIVVKTNAPDRWLEEYEKKNQTLCKLRLRALHSEC